MEENAPLGTEILPAERHDQGRSAPAAGGKRAFIQSYGCQMNVHDAERMADLLAGQGYSAAESAERADLVILNTCHIREKASEKVYSELGRLRELKAERSAAGGRAMTIAVAGCVAQAEGAEIFARQPAVDLVVGPQSYHRLPELLEQATNIGRPGRAIDTEFPVDDKFAHLPAPSARRLLARGPSAFLTVQEGCDKFCSFCVVPFTRGAENSRPVAAILDEARGMIAAGVREIMLLGQNVNAYHGALPAGGSADLAELIFRLAEIPGLARLRYATSHPNDMTDALIAAHRDCATLMPYLHLPVQAGSNRVLKAMNRKHRAADYLETIARVRAARPDIAITSDFITGFPGETDADFEATLALVREVRFAAAYSFRYSPRPGTKAAERTDGVPESVAIRRLHALQALILEQQTAFNAACLDRVLPILFEKAGRLSGQIVGKSPYLQAVHLELGAGADVKPWIGRLADVRITRLGANSLHGVLADDRKGTMA